MLAFVRRHFLTGLLAISPLAITAWILWRFYEFISGTMRPWVQRLPALSESYPEFFLTFAGFVIFVLLITLIGVFTRNLIGVAFFRLLEGLVQQIPVVKSMYSGTKQIATLFLQDRRTAFQKVVLFEYPRKGLWSIGFVAADAASEIRSKMGGDEAVAVFVATSPNPTSGILVFAKRRDLVSLAISTEDAFELVMSGGLIKPGDVEEAHPEATGATAPAS